MTDNGKPWAPEAAIDGPGSIQFVPTPLAGFTDLMGFHRHLLDDRARTGAFVDAVNRVVRPGDVVVDLGTGTGILAMAAARAGARRVYALDFSIVARLAARIAAANGLGDRIVFLERDSREVMLPEPADVIVSECLGFFGVAGTMIAAVSDFARRNLRPGGVVLPRTVTGWLAPVEGQAAFDYAHPFAPTEALGYDMSEARALSAHNLYVARFSARDFLSAPQSPATVRFLPDLPNGLLVSHLRFPISKPRTLHGFCGYFDTELCEGLTLRTGPDDAATVWRQTYLPLPDAIPLERGDEIRLEVCVEGARGMLPVVISWNTQVIRSTGAVVGTWRQSTERSVPSLKS